MKPLFRHKRTLRAIELGNPSPARSLTQSLAEWALVHPILAGLSLAPFALVGFWLFVVIAMQGNLFFLP